MASRHVKYTREVLESAVRESTSVMGVLKRNGAHLARLTAEDVLVRVPPGSRRTKPHLLRRALAEIGRPHVWVRCGNDGRWMGEQLRLQVDHVDGDFHNNEPTNLRYLCPNCLSQTENYAGRSRNKYAHTLADHTNTGSSRG